MQSVIELLKIAFGQSHFKASLDPRNIPSIKLMEKLGFKKEGLYPKRFQMHGEWVDDLVYVLKVD
jgi:RimJ/RimL family protein N-acetyltransferase